MWSDMVDSPRTDFAPAWADAVPPLVHEGPARNVLKLPQCGAFPAAGFGCDALQSDCQGRTTLMFRHLPRSLSRDTLVCTINAMGFAGRYDLVYLPVNFGSGMGLGYALVNLTSARDVPALWAALEGYAQWGTEPGEGACSVAWSDPNQGLESFVARYRNSPVLHPDVPDNWKPAIYGVHGERLAFPTPNRTVKA